MGTQKIFCGYGPEDIALEKNARHHRIIISCTRRKFKKQLEGGIWYYDFNNDCKATPFQFYNYEIANLKPHGICVVNHEDYSELFVISHEQDDRIIKFRIEDDHLVKEYVINENGEYSSLFKAINDLYVDSNENIYVTSPGGITLFKKKGNVFVLTQDAEPLCIIDDLFYPNGIHVYEGFLYVAALRGKQVYRYRLISEREVDIESRVEISNYDQYDEIDEIVGGDNLTRSGEELIIANHPKPIRFMLHAATFGTNWPEVKSPSSVYSFHVKTGKLTQLFGNKKEDHVISGSSTALKVGEDLYISQVFDNFLLKIKNVKNTIPVA